VLMNKKDACDACDVYMLSYAADDTKRERKMQPGVGFLFDPEDVHRAGFHAPRREIRAAACRQRCENQDPRAGACHLFDRF